MVQGLVRAPVVVAIPKPVNPALELLERGRLIRVEEPQQGLMGALVLALDGEFSRQAADGHGAFGGEEDLHGANSSGPQLVERRGVVRKRLLGPAVGGADSFENVLGIGTVLGTGIRCCAHIEARSVIEQLVHGHDLSAGESVLKASSCHNDIAVARTNGMYEDFGRFLGNASTWPTLESRRAIVATEGTFPPGNFSCWLAS